MTLDHIQSHLDDAEGWGTWDIMGGGFISDMAKHDALDKAQELVENLQIELRRFKAELADVSVHADFQVSIDGFMRFADFFFDGLFADWAVMDQIEQSQKQLADTENQLATALNELQKMRTVAEQNLKTTKTELDNYIYGL